MVRLVFRPFTQVWQSICTSEMLRASTRVSSGFTLLTCSSPSFGSYHICSFSSPSSENQDWMLLPPCGFVAFSRFLYAIGFFHPITCIWDRLLGPCFKTGRIKSSWQNLHTESSTSLSVLAWSSIAGASPHFIPDIKVHSASCIRKILNRPLSTV